MSPPPDAAWRWPILLSLTMLAPAAMAGPKVPAGPAAFVVILGGGKTQADAQAVLARFGAVKTAVQAPPGYPRQLASEQMPGLNPGFLLAVLGVCAKEAEASAARDVLNVDLPGVYTRRVGVAATEGACPRLRTATPSVPLRKLARVSVSPVAPEHAAPVVELWSGIVLGHEPRNLAEVEDACQGVVLRARAGGLLLAEYVNAPEIDHCQCRSDFAPTQPCLHTSVSALPTVVGGRTLFLVSEAHADGDYAGTSYRLVTFACGRFTESSVSPGAEGDGGWPQLDPQRPAEPDSWKALRFIGAPYVWDDASCAYKDGPAN